MLDRRSREMFDQLVLLYARQIYQGYYHDLCSQMIRAALVPVTRLITGSVTVRLYKGNVGYVKAEAAPHSLYTLDGSMEKEGSFNHADSEGFLRVLAVNARAIAHKGHLKG